MVNHLSFSGEMGYQIYCKLQYLMLLANEIEDFGADLVCRWYDARAFMSMRLEKGWGFQAREFWPDFNAVEPGVDAFNNWKQDFVGK